MHLCGTNKRMFQAKQLLEDAVNLGRAVCGGGSPGLFFEKSAKSWRKTHLSKSPN